MSGSRAKEARKALEQYKKLVEAGEEQATTIEVLALSLGVSAKWVRRNMRSTENQ